MKYKLENIGINNYNTIEDDTQFEIAQQLCNIANELAIMNTPISKEESVIDIEWCYLNGDYQSQCAWVGRDDVTKILAYVDKIEVYINDKLRQIYPRKDMCIGLKQ